MVIIRPVCSDDLQNIYELAQKTGGGLTTLPADKERLMEKIRESEKNFDYKPSCPRGETYFFVLEDIEQKKVIGTSALYSKVGGFYPFWTYELKSVVKESKKLGVCKKVQYLQVKMEHNGPSEVGTLFLDPDYRHSGNGRLLSLSRFLFVAAYRSCFEDSIVAELRGRIDSEGHSVFWDSIGAHFFNVPFEKADLMVNEDKHFIDELMPKHPIYVPLLPEEAQRVIGKVHDDTRPAMRLLKSEGFEQIHEVDIFEAGPILQASSDDIRCVKDSKTATLASEAMVAPSEDEKSRLYMVANTTDIKNYRVAICQLTQQKNNKVSISSAATEALDLRAGDELRYVEFRAEVKG